jgi:hypothetical protein
MCYQRTNNPADVTALIIRERKSGDQTAAGPACIALDLVQVLNHPARRRTDFLPQQQVKLRGVVLKMALVLKEQFRAGYLKPPESGGSPKTEKHPACSARNHAHVR